MKYHCSRVKEKNEEKPDEMAIVDFVSDYFIQKLRGCNYPAEVVRQIMAHITEVVVEKFSTEIEKQEKLPFKIGVKGKDEDNSDLNYFLPPFIT